MQKAVNIYINKAANDSDNIYGARGDGIARRGRGRFVTDIGLVKPTKGFPAACQDITGFP